jgi:UDP-glucose 4-epimerase
MTSAGGVVLVTGGCGFLGSHLVKALCAQGRRVRILDDLSVGAHRPPAGVEFVRASVLDVAAVTRAARDVTTVFHLAGLVGMRLAASRARHAYEVASAGSRNVLAATGDADVVLFSSSAVYGGGGDGAMCEEEPIDRATPLAYDGGVEGYATGKWELERLGREAAASGRRILVVRPFNVVGPGQVSSYGMVVPTFVERALLGRPLVVYGDGTQRRCFSDVAEFTRSVLRLEGTASSWLTAENVVNVGSDREISIRGLADHVRVATGADVPVVHRPYAEVFPNRTDVARRVPSLRRLHRHVGPTAWIELADIVRAVVAQTRHTMRLEGAL